MAKGKLIVIDGTDGSGKATQTKLLIKRLQKTGRRVKYVDFPQYGKKSAGPIEDYLNGHYGTAEELGAYIPSMFFAVDRYAASKQIRKYLKDGFVVISNRYVTANMAHQGGKIKSAKDREKFYNWLDELEYTFFKIPKPNLGIILHLPAKISAKLLKKRGPTYYIGSKKGDIHEKSSEHLRAAEKIYQHIAEKFRYPVVEGYVDGKLQTPDEIHEKVYKIVKKYLRG